MNRETVLRAGERSLRVSLAPEGEGWAARLDGVAYDVRCLARGPRLLAGTGTMVEELVLEIDGRVQRLIVAHRHGHALVALAGRVHRLETGVQRRRGRTHVGAGSGTVTVPMPGKIIAVLVNVGDLVVPGQPLVVLEAMKMESTLAAEIAGRVAAVHATPGSTVEEGTIVVEIASP